VQGSPPKIEIARTPIKKAEILGEASVSSRVSKQFKLEAHFLGSW
jgi:hypothetical protein